MVKVAILDDYADFALKAADWSVLPPDTQTETFREHVADIDALASRLKGCEVVSIMRERTAFPRALLEQLPDLKLLVTTGARNASIDMQAATDLGILVCGTGGLGYPTAELTWGIILVHAAIHPQGSSSLEGRTLAVHRGHRRQWQGVGCAGIGALGFAGGRRRQRLRHGGSGLEPEPYP